MATLARVPHLSFDRAGRALHPIRTRRTLASRRASADEWLLWGAVPRASSELLDWRARELTSQPHRAELARLARRFVAERGDPRCRAYAVNRAAIGKHLRLLVEIEERLQDANRTVTPRGVILAGRVLLDGAGPLFNSARADELGPMLSLALDALGSPEEGDHPA